MSRTSRDCRAAVCPVPMQWRVEALTTGRLEQSGRLRPPLWWPLPYRERALSLALRFIAGLELIAHRPAAWFIQGEASTIARQHDRILSGPASPASPAHSSMCASIISAVGSRGTITKPESASTSIAALTDPRHLSLRASVSVRHRPDPSQTSHTASAAISAEACFSVGEAVSAIMILPRRCRADDEGSSLQMILRSVKPHGDHPQERPGPLVPGFSFARARV